MSDLSITLSNKLTIREDWATNYNFQDGDGKVTVFIKGRQAVPANPRATPPTLAIPPCNPYQFTLWSAATTPTYATQNALNNGGGYLNGDLISGITAYLSKMAGS